MTLQLQMDFQEPEVNPEDQGGARDPQFDAFAEEWGKYYGVSMQTFVSNNIKLKTSLKGKEIPDLPENFLYFSLFKELPQECEEKYNELFGKIKNLNGRSPHQYLCDQVMGKLGEHLHLAKLQKLYPEYKFKFNGCEFDLNSQQSYIFTSTSGVRQGSDIIVNNKRQISVKRNAYWNNEKKFTFRGSRRGKSEYEKIKSQELSLHFIISPTKYIALKDIKEMRECADDIQFLPLDNEWGGKGATRFLFNNKINELIQTY